MPKPKKQYAKVFPDMLEPLRDMTATQKASILDALDAYLHGTYIHIEDPAARMAFTFLKLAFDRDMDAYAEICEQNRKNVNARHQKKQAAQVAEQLDLLEQEEEQVDPVTNQKVDHVMSHSDPKLDHAEDQNLEHIENAVEVTEVTTVYDRKQPYTTAYESYDRIRPYTKVTTVYDRYQDKDKEKDKTPLSLLRGGDGVVASLHMATPVSGGGDCLAEVVPVGEVLPVAMPKHAQSMQQVASVEQVQLVQPQQVELMEQVELMQPAPVQVESPTAPIAQPEPVEQEVALAPDSYALKFRNLGKRFKAKQQAQPTAGPTPQAQPTATEQPHPQGKAAQAAYVERSDTMPSVAPSPVTPEQAQARLECLLLGTARTAASPVQPPRSRRNRNAATTGDYSPEFLTFWNMYPRKVAKEAAYRAWVQRARTRTLPPLDTLSAVLSRQAQTKQWLKNDGQYIPFPATWLHQARWEGSV